MRGSWCCCALMLSAVFASGCAASSNYWRKIPSVAEKKPADAAVEKGAQKAEKRESPFIAERERGAAKTTADKPGETKTTAEKPTTKNATSPGSKLALSAETLKLIDEELKDATPEERAEWYEQLKRVEPSVIPEILRARRLSLQVSKAATKPAAPIASADAAAWSQPSASPAASDGILQAGHRTRSTAAPVSTAGYQSPANFQPQIDQAIHRSDPRTADTAVVLQGFEAEAPIATGVPVNAPAAVQRQVQSDPAAPAVPWPPTAKTPPAANSRSSLAPPLSFGAGLVQNVVGLVPNRNASGANSPTTTVQPALQTVAEPEWRAELVRAIALLEQEIATQRPGAPTEDDVRKQVSLRLMYLMADHQERALTAIPGIDPAEQEFWQQVVWGISNALDARHIPRAEDRATQTIAQLNTAVRRLQEKADLQVRNVTFSKQNFGYGNYDRFVRDEVRPGQDVLLYAEIENFKSDPTADGQYRTLLRSTIEILSPAGEVRKKFDFPATEDLCRNYRRDYFHNYQFTIPDRLPLGPHVLKLAVFDELSGKMATYTLNFLVN
jgi:hypothetical protein